MVVVIVLIVVVIVVIAVVVIVVLVGEVKTKKSSFMMKQNEVIKVIKQNIGQCRTRIIRVQYSLILHYETFLL